MTRRMLFLCAFALAVATSPASAAILQGSPLALPVSTAPDGDLLAQRVIDREWGLSEDSTYNEVDVPGWKSEGGAMALSALVPGTGQLYVGAKSGWAFLLLETAGWVQHELASNAAADHDQEAQAFVGNPYDSTAGWSLSRYESSGGGDTDYLERLWVGDREAYYRALETDPAYVVGFTGPSPGSTQQEYAGMRDQRDDKLKMERRIEVLLWLNHVVAAVDAFRAARIHNLPLRQQYQLRVSQKYRRGNPEARVAVVRRF